MYLLSTLNGDHDPQQESSSEIEDEYDYTRYNKDETDVFIGDGPHKQELCEACAKGKCSQGNNSQMTSGRQSARGGGGGRVIQIPSLNGRPDDMVDGKFKVKWRLTFEKL